MNITFLKYVLRIYIYGKFYDQQVVLAGFCLPFLGFVFGGTVAVLMKRKWEDIVAISIETGVQNTGLAVGVINVSQAKVFLKFKNHE